MHQLMCVLPAGMGQLNLCYLFAVFITSAVLGDAVNYAIGNKLGEHQGTKVAAWSRSARV